MSDPGGPQDSPPPGYLIPSDDQRGVQPSGRDDAPRPAAPEPPKPAEPAPPAFTLPSAEPESPVGGPPQPSGNNPGTTQIPVDSGPSGYGAQRGAYEGGSYAQPNTPAYGQPNPPQSSPPAYQQSAPPAYPQSSPPNYQQSGPPAYQQSSPPAYQQSSPPAYQQSAPPAYPQSSPPGYDQAGYPQYPQSAVPTTGYDQAAGYQQVGGYPVGPPAPQYGVTLPQSKPPNSGLAVGSMITGIGSSALIAVACCLGMFAGIPMLLAGGTGLVLGIMARKQIQESNGAQGGAGMALAGIITGAVGGAVGLVLIILGVAFIGMSASGAFDS